MTHKRISRIALAAAAAGALALVAAPAVQAGGTHQTHHSSTHAKGKPLTLPGGYKHLVVIYEENHSFDNLYGTGARSTARTSTASDATSEHRRRSPRTARRTPACCRTTSTWPARSLADDLPRHAPSERPDRHPGRLRQPLHEQPFTIDDYIAPTDTTCPPPGHRVQAERRASRAPAYPAAAPATSCTASTRSSTRSTAASRTATRPAPTRSASPRASTTRRSCRSTSTCTAQGAPNYVIADDFFQAAFGGSFLNHQWLIAAPRTPLDTPEPADRSTQLGRWTRTGCPTTLPASTRRPSAVDGRRS